jgi:AcrR family transcriptional regulator
MSHDTPPRPAEIPPQQARSRRTRDAIVAALEELLREGTFQAASVADIAERAGVAVGSVYRRFENKDAMIPALFDLYFERWEVHRRAVEADPPQLDAGLRAVLHHAALRAWHFMTREAHILRAVHLYSRLRPELARDEWDRLRDESRQSFRRLFEHFSDEVRRDDLDEAAEACSYFFNTAFIDRALYPEMGPAAGMKLDGEDFVLTMADFAWAWLTAKA